MWQLTIPSSWGHFAPVLAFVTPHTGFSPLCAIFLTLHCWLFLLSLTSKCLSTSGFICMLKKKKIWGVPSWLGLVVRILGFHFCDPGSSPGWRTKILQAMLHSQKKKKIFSVYSLPRKLDLSKFIALASPLSSSLMHSNANLPSLLGCLIES